MANGTTQTDQQLDPVSEDIRNTAYLLWEQDGRPEGRADEYWYRALDQYIGAAAQASPTTPAPRSSTRARRQQGPAQ